MPVTNVFIEAVKSDSKRKVRIMMKDSLLVDPSFVEFKEMEKAASTISGLYEEHDGREFKSDRSEWNDDYMDLLMIQVVGNFSIERINHLKDVVAYLRPVAKTMSTSNNRNIKNTNTTRTNKPSSNVKRNDNYQQQKNRDIQNGSYIGAKVATGVVAGVVVGGVVSTVGSLPVSGSVVVGGIAGGVLAYIVSERN